mmetsp:Transcript_24476/g.34523  ORF Transcript_24476/g.34523 Transcript_24476/m.34523 type:complete len:169 (-) Transcript_24476:318-824(-)
MTNTTSPSTIPNEEEMNGNGNHMDVTCDKNHHDNNTNLFDMSRIMDTDGLHYVRPSVSADEGDAIAHGITLTSTTTPAPSLPTRRTSIEETNNKSSYSQNALHGTIVKPPFHSRGYSGRSIHQTIPTSITTTTTASKPPLQQQQQQQQNTKWGVGQNNISGGNLAHCA